MPKTLYVSAKCSDLCFVRYPNGTGHDGYVPEGIGIGGVNYIELDIDVETGQIQGWTDDVKETIKRYQAGGKV